MLSCLSCALLFSMLWTIAHQALLSMGFSSQEYWGWLPWPPPGDLPNSETEPPSHVSCIGRQVLHHEHHLGSLLGGKDDLNKLVRAIEYLSFATVKTEAHYQFRIC